MARITDGDPRIKIICKGGELILQRLRSIPVSVEQYRVSITLCVGKLGPGLVRKDPASDIRRVRYSSQEAAPTQPRCRFFAFVLALGDSPPGSRPPSASKANGAGEERLFNLGRRPPPPAGSPEGSRKRPAMTLKCK